jgi:hypothetical protein
MKLVTLALVFLPAGCVEAPDPDPPRTEKCEPVAAPHNLGWFGTYDIPVCEGHRRQ